MSKITKPLISKKLPTAMPALAPVERFGAARGGSVGEEGGEEEKDEEEVGEFEVLAEDGDGEPEVGRALRYQSGK